MGFIFVRRSTMFSTKIYNRMRLMVLGDEQSGKTSLLQALKRESPQSPAQTNQRKVISILCLISMRKHRSVPIEIKFYSQLPNCGDLRLVVRENTAHIHGSYYLSHMGFQWTGIPLSLFPSPRLDLSSLAWTPIDLSVFLYSTNSVFNLLENERLRCQWTDIRQHP